MEKTAGMLLHTSCFLEVGMQGDSPAVKGGCSGSEVIRDPPKGTIGFPSGKKVAEPPLFCWGCVVHSPFVFFTNIYVKIV